MVYYKNVIRRPNLGMVGGEEEKKNPETLKDKLASLGMRF